MLLLGYKETSGGRVTYASPTLSSKLVIWFSTYDFYEGIFS